MKISKKILVSIFIVICMFSTIQINQSQAQADAEAGIGMAPGASGGESLEEQIGFNASYWKPNSTTSVTNATRLESIGNTIIGVIRTIGSILSVAVLIIIGIKYMMGSAEERAEYKKTMIPYVVGAIIVFGITNLLSIIVSLTENLL